jgi:Ser/Thr protein kinase RdoA (MazF antagonist)
VPEPVQTLDGENLVSVVAEDGVPRFCVLFGYVPGRFLQRGLRPRHLEQVGTLTARLHTYSEQLTVPDWFERPVVDRVDEEFEESVAGRFREGWSVEAAETIAAALQRVREVQKELGRSSATFGVIHADIHHWNYLFHAGRIRLIDFDDFGWGHYLYDLAVTTQQINRLPRGPELWRALLDGYRRARALSPEHEAMVESFRMLREIQDMNFDLALCDDPTQARIPLVMAELQRFLESHC